MNSETRSTIGAPSARGYVSDELTHFVGRALANDERRFELLVEVLRSGWLTFPPHRKRREVRATRVQLGGLASEDDMYEPRAVCFCDIPFEHLPLHMSKYSRFGIAFTKGFLLAKGASPVFYMALDSPVWKRRIPRLRHTRVDDEELADFEETAGAFIEEEWEKLDRGGVIDKVLVDRWSLIRTRSALLERHDLPSDLAGHLAESQRLDLALEHLVFAYLKLFRAGSSEAHAKHYYLEREWRVLDNVQFALSDVVRVIVPRVFSERLTAELPDIAKSVEPV